MRFSFILFVCGIALSAYQPEPLALSKQRGKKIYELNCQTCHGDDGMGASGVFPPLAKADYLMQNRNRAIRQVLYGARGTMIVNGYAYTGEMPAQSELSDTEVADVLNYIRNSWGNQDTKPITPQDVRAQRR